MQIAGSVAIVTGSNRGVGRELVEALLERGAATVYAAARTPATLEPVIALDPQRVIPVELDLTRGALIDAAAGVASDVTLVINNGAIAQFVPGRDAPRCRCMGWAMRQPAIRGAGELQRLRRNHRLRGCSEARKGLCRTPAPRGQGG